MCAVALRVKTAYSVSGSCQRFGGSCCFHSQGILLRQRVQTTRCHNREDVEPSKAKDIEPDPIRTGTWH
jgi:hypothetical protein